MTTTKMLETIDIFDVPVNVLDSYTHVGNCIAERIEQGQKTFCVAINPDKICKARYDPALEAILKQEADIRICDSAGIVFAAKVLHGKSMKRCTGVDLFAQMLTLAAQKGWRVFLLGATRDVNAAVCANLLKLHPSLQIAGCSDGYFRSSAEAVEKVNASRADLLFVAMGSPKQELWISKHRHDIDALFCMGVGGTFDVIGGKVKRAPKLFRKTGTEGLYRLLTHPKWTMKLKLKRGFVLLLFILKVIKSKIFRYTPLSKYV